MTLQAKLGWAAGAIIASPALIFAFVHSHDEAQKWVNLANAFCWPAASVVLTLAKRRPAVYYYGIACLVLPMVLLFASAYWAAVVHPSKQQIATLYIPTFFFTVMIGLPAGVALTYLGSRPKT